LRVVILSSSLAIPWPVAVVSSKLTQVSSQVRSYSGLVLAWIRYGNRGKQRSQSRNSHVHMHFKYKMFLVSTSLVFRFWSPVVAFFSSNYSDADASPSSSDKAISRPMATVLLCNSPNVHSLRSNGNATVCGDPARLQQRLCCGSRKPLIQFDVEATVPSGRSIEPSP